MGVWGERVSPLIFIMARPKKPTEKKKLTPKQDKFVESYISNGGNGTKAAIEAGYSKNCAQEIASENLLKPIILQRIEERKKDARVTTDEIVGTLVSQMRSDVTDLFTEGGAFSLSDIREKRLGHLVKKIKCRRVIEGKDEDETPVDVIEIELHNPQSAAIQLCKVFGIEQLPKPNEDAAKWEKIAKDLAKKYRRPIEEVRRDLVQRKPELASVLIQ